MDSDNLMRRSPCHEDGNLAAARSTDHVDTAVVAVNHNNFRAIGLLLAHKERDSDLLRNHSDTKPSALNAVLHLITPSLSAPY